jgi:tRNA (mo5U34)-methyltransferase
VDPESLKKKVAKVSWFHTIDLGNGIITPGADDSPSKLKTLKIAEDLSRLSVLDIGAWDGFFSFEAERRGASRVVATDSFVWQGKTWGGKCGFELARAALNSRVEDVTVDVLDLSPEKLGTFDLVFFLGVLYHMKHPLLALERVANITKGMLILETHVDRTWDKRPMMMFYPESELDGDPSNWCGPNPAAVEAMLKSVGFKRVKQIARSYGLGRRLASATKRRLTRNESFLQRVQQNRCVFHAWK